MKLWICTILLCATTPALAETMSEDFIEKKIKKGDWTVGGYAELFYASQGGARVRAIVDAQYFLIDNLSLGAVMRLQGGKAFDSSGAGVKGTYHFYETARSTFYVSGEVSYNLVDSEFFSPSNEYATMGTIGLGWNNFITPNVAFGPRIEYTRLLGNNVPNMNNKDYNLSVLLGFSLFF